MAVPSVSTNFGDLLDPRFQRIFHEQYRQLPNMLPKFYNFEPHNGRDNMTWSGVGAFGDWEQFTGSVNYDDVTQAYDTTLTWLEFTSGFQVERKLFDDDQFNIMEQRPRGLATAYQRTRQKHGARFFNNAFSNDLFFAVNTEGVAPCSNSHTTNAAGVDTTTGFDNLTTAALSATAVNAAVIQMRKFRDDRGNRMTITPNTMLVPIDLREEAFEIVMSQGKVDTANNNKNIHFEAFDTVEWEYLTDTNNWFVMDTVNMNQMLYWVDRVESEFAMAEDIDTLIAKWRGYARYGAAWIDWRFINGASVS